MGHIYSRIKNIVRDHNLLPKYNYYYNFFLRRSMSPELVQRVHQFPAHLVLLGTDMKFTV